MSGDMSDIKTIFSSAVKKFQEFAGLKVTGKLTEETKRKMAEPRCGSPDVQAMALSSESVYKWKKEHLTFSILSYTNDIQRSDIKRVLQDAFDTWAKVVPLDFTGGVLAHATFPPSGTLHFDDTEDFVYMVNGKPLPNGKVDLFSVAVHEMGHALGLSHSRKQESIMAPFYKESTDNSGNYIKPSLDRSDVQEIQDIYGARRSPFRPHSNGGDDNNDDRGRGSSHTTIPPRSRTTTSKSFWGRIFGGGDDESESGTTKRFQTTTYKPDRSNHGGSSGGGSSSSGGCPHSLDSFISLNSRTGYVFSGSTVYEVGPSSSGPYSSVTKKSSLSSLFPGAPSNVEAAVTDTSSGLTLLFAANRVYGYKYSSLHGFTMDSEFPKRLPGDILFIPSGALIWNDGHLLILSPNGQFAVYDPYWNQSSMSGIVSRYFGSLPSGVKGGFSNSNSRNEMILFTSSKVYKFNTQMKQSLDGSSSLSDYFNC
uniref:ZnMc domain-containing protein n=1 Tax=Rhabditophanes sp. KR3021 TaxID=114890 RepID=A0AC35UGG5_9BILA